MGAYFDAIFIKKRPFKILFIQNFAQPENPGTFNVLFLTISGTYSKNITYILFFSGQPLMFQD